MNLTEFSWHPAREYDVGDAGMEFRRGGQVGPVYAAVGCSSGEWFAVWGLCPGDAKVRRVPFGSERDAIQAVESWVEALEGNGRA